MSNDLGSNPIEIDSEGATSAITKPLRIKAIRWYRPTTADHKASLLVASGGDTVWKANATVAKQDLVQYFGQVGIRVDGLYCDDLDSGILYIYVA